MTPSQASQVRALAGAHGGRAVLAAAHALAGRDRVVAVISRALVDATAGEELRPCSADAPGHDLDAGGAS